ncbi:hypothetical protein L2E82_38890 [Cichorium intybus]|uniref:Uncharacterized protein n=1 Tax=Cichorium intybus TaxID=13427 RepID=A0ACB9AGP9_CICIN|nr:hypothetical protein L2E82_38890 [Cichorium intybus]
MHNLCSHKRGIKTNTIPRVALAGKPPPQYQSRDKNGVFALLLLHHLLSLTLICPQLSLSIVNLISPNSYAYFALDTAPIRLKFYPSCYSKWLEAFWI